MGWVSGNLPLIGDLTLEHLNAHMEGVNTPHRLKPSGF